jgi:hypothetical protein
MRKYLMKQRAGDDPLDINNITFDKKDDCHFLVDDVAGVDAEHRLDVFVGANAVGTEIVQFTPSIYLSDVCLDFKSCVI